MNTYSSIRTLSLCALIGVGSAIGAIQVATAAESPQIVVSYRDLDLKQPADARVLYVRLQRAAQSVCPAVNSVDLSRYAGYQRCVSAALDNAVQRVGSSELLALHHAVGDARIRG
jgi:UrcA family protein